MSYQAAHSGSDCISSSTPFLIGPYCCHLLWEFIFVCRNKLKHLNTIIIQDLWKLNLLIGFIIVGIFPQNELIIKRAIVYPFRYLLILVRLSQYWFRFPFSGLHWNFLQISLEFQVYSVMFMFRMNFYLTAKTKYIFWSSKIIFSRVGTNIILCLSVCFYSESRNSDMPIVHRGTSNTNYFHLDL